MEIKKVYDLGKEVDFAIVSEDWNRYDLSDGSILKIRPIVVKVFVSSKKAPTGEPVFGYGAITIASAIVPDKLKKRSNETEDIETPVDFKPAKEVWNVFNVEGKFNLKVRLVVARVTRTSKRNEFGEPIYTVKSDNVADAEPIES